MFLGQRENCFGLKIMFLGWKKGHTWVEKKRKAGRKRRSGAETETEKGREVRRWSRKKEKGWNRKKEERRGTEAEPKRGLEQRIFQHLFSFKSSQKNYGEFVYVEFNF